jgi:hypothetical protein
MRLTDSVVVTLTLILALTGCTQGQSETVPETPLPPPGLLDLPVDAQTLCLYDPERGGGTVVWELPGVEPSDQNSAYMGDRGEILGNLSPCTPVTITDYAWSPTDELFYVYIVVDGLEGWIGIDSTDLVP